MFYMINKDNDIMGTASGPIQAEEGIFNVVYLEKPLENPFDYKWDGNKFVLREDLIKEAEEDAQ